ncbi:MAG: thiamine-phosphate kinase, partial [Gammaproteobacteria bacterium]|nr:thiamine-phosphate kinase [Gammaproteobacteria bacterium]
MALDEFTLIRRYFSPPTARGDVTLGVGDDAALLTPAPGQELAVTTDTLLAGVHFPDDLSPESVGYRALAVNLSDIAAMGAAPCWATLALSLPRPDEIWVAAFARGFLELADEFGVALVGGDTVKGPLGITVQVIGQVPVGKALRRAGARPGDAVMVSGVTGLAAAALQLRAAGRPVPESLARRFDRPYPRIALGLALRDRANACIDVSDGLAADFVHILTASGCGATLDVEKLAIPAQGDAFTVDQRLSLALDGGDDYELCFTCTAQSAATLKDDPVFAGCRRIGVVESRPGLRLRTADGGCSENRGHGY